MTDKDSKDPVELWIHEHIQLSRGYLQVKVGPSRPDSTVAHIALEVHRSHEEWETPAPLAELRTFVDLAPMVRRMVERQMLVLLTPQFTALREAMRRQGTPSEAVEPDLGEHRLYILAELDKLDSQEGGTS